MYAAGANLAMEAGYRSQFFGYLAKAKELEFNSWS
jgi:hypothetical protein